jgi:hypothetical protein
MKTKNPTIVFIGAVLLVIGSGIRQGMAIATVSPVSEPAQLSSILAALQGGPGPVCIPGVGGCENVQSVDQRQGGPGPVCIPGVGGCRNILGN